jgi:DNA-binding response OmpR family regulator
VISTTANLGSIVPALSGFPKPSLSATTGYSGSGSSKVTARSRRIVVIDDEPSIADSLAEILTTHGFKASAFYGGQGAIDFARKQCPDIVLSDVVMPKMNGVDTVLAIRELCPQTRVFLFSGQAGTTNILERARASGHRFELLPKPLHPDELLKRLSSS